jgi:GT2 family glycosyltransferase
MGGREDREEEHPMCDRPLEAEATRRRLPAVQPPTWSVVIPTLNRFDILCEAVRRAAEQTLPPKEIVVVDASAEAGENGSRLGGMFDYPQTRLVYIEASERSSSIQRNTGIRHCSSDVIFFIDDDCLMYPDYAETIMAVYRADVSHQVAGILGSLAAEPYPPQIAREESQSGDRSGASVFWNRLREILFGRMSLFPYLDGYPEHKRPSLDTPVAYRVCKLMSGCCCSYRRSVIQQVLFDQDLVFYVTGEDLDASYRASFQGVLLEVPSAKLFHVGHPSARPDFYTKTLVKISNNAFWVQKHNPRRFKTKAWFLIRLARYLPGEALYDLFDLFGWRQLSFPKTRGFLAALWPTLRLFSMPSSQMVQWYRGYLENLFRRRECLDLNRRVRKNRMN